MTPAELAAASAYQQEQQRLAAQNQQESPNILDIVGKLALGAGVAAAGTLGVRRLLRGGAQQAATLQDIASVGKQAAPTVEKAVERLGEINQYTRQARTERPAGIVQAKLPTVSELVAAEEEYRAFRPDVRESLSPAVAEARRQQATANLLAQVQKMREPYQASLPGINPTLMAIRGVAQEAAEVAPSVVYQPGPSVRLSAAPKQLGIPFESLTTQHQANLPSVSAHAANALGSAEDQITGNMTRAVQRNEDLNPEQLRNIMQGRREAAIARGLKGPAVERSLIMRPEERAAFEASVAMSQPTPEVTVPTVGAPGAGGMGLLETGAVTGSRPSVISQAPSGGAIRGISRADYGLSTRNPSTQEFEELGGGMGVYGIEKEYASGAVEKETGEYKPAATRKPTDFPPSSKRAFPEGVMSPFAKLSDEELGMMSMVGEGAEAEVAQKMLERRQNLDLSREIDRIYKSNPRELAQQKVSDLIKTLKGEQ